MNELPHAAIGGTVDQLPTPCLTLDAQALRTNLQRMQGFLKRAGKHLRAHSKTHKCSRLARLQVETGAIGICAAKLSEAEGLQKQGIRNLLVTGPIVTPEAHRRLVACAAADPDFLITLDDFDNARKISDALVAAGLTLPCLLDLDIGQQRTGVAPADAPSFAKALSRLPGLRLIGMQAYAGHAQHLISVAERREVNHRCVGTAREVFHQLRDFGLEVFSVGGTGSCAFDIAFPEVTEIQAGSYALMDADYLALEQTEPPYLTALTLQTTVVSTNQRGFVTVDAGLKSLYRDGATPQVVHPAGQGLAYDWFGDEYGRIQIADATACQLKVGDRLALAVSHCDPTVNLFDFYYLVENGHVQDVWPIDLRGCSQ